MSDYDNRYNRDAQPTPPTRPLNDPPVSSGAREYDAPAPQYQQRPPLPRNPQASRPQLHRTTDVEREQQERAEQRLAILERIRHVIYFLVHALAILILFRFVLLASGANAQNSFADFIYALSYPFAAPFSTLFGGTPQYGNSVFEISSLIAIAVYYLLAWGLIRIVKLAFAPSDPTGQAYD